MNNSKYFFCEACQTETEHFIFTSYASDGEKHEEKFCIECDDTSPAT